MLNFTLPWPPKELSPNGRTHWRVLAKTKKAYREACAWTAKEQGAGRIECDSPATADLLDAMFAVDRAPFAGTYF